MSKFLYQNEKRIPAPLGILIVLVVLLAPVLLIQVHRNQQKEDSIAVQDIDVSNITHKTATISWKTKEKVTGYVYYGEENKDISTVVSDDRDTKTIKIPRYIHYVTLKNLSPSTSYFVKLKHTNMLFSFNTKENLRFTTAAPQPLSGGRPPLYGKLVDRAGSPVKDALVLVSIKNTALLSTLTKEDGSFLISLCCLVDGSSYESYSVSDTDIASIRIESESSENSKIAVTVGEAHPLAQTLVLGQDKNYITQEKSIQEDENLVLAASDITTQDSQKFDQIDIFYPKDNATIAGGRPLFKGRVLPNTTLSLDILPDGQRRQLTGDDEGIWSYTPQKDLSQGSHTLVMDTKDATNKKVKKERAFIILKSGEAVLGEATLEATLTPVLTEIPITPVEILTLTPYITQEITLTPTQTPPVSGISYTTFSLMSAALILFGVGMILVF